MKDNEIKELFLQADKRLLIDEERKRQVYEKASTELVKQNNYVITQKDILLNQLRYMDKTFLSAYGVFAMFGIIIVCAMRYLEADFYDTIVIFVIGASILSTISIVAIDKMYFGKMAELGASCYYGTRQCVACYMVISGGIDLTILLFLTVFISSFWKIKLIQTCIYLLIPFLVTSIVQLRLLSMEISHKKPYLSVVSGLFLLVVYLIILSIPTLYFALSVWILGTVCAISGVILGVQIKSFITKLDEGGLLCMN